MMKLYILVLSVALAFSQVNGGCVQVGNDVLEAVNSQIANDPTIITCPHAVSEELKNRTDDLIAAFVS